MIRKRTIDTNGKKTSISLEDGFYSELKRLAKHDGTNISQQVEFACVKFPNHNRCSAVRCYVLDRVQHDSTN